MNGTFSRRSSTFFSAPSPSRGKPAIGTRLLIQAALQLNEGGIGSSESVQLKFEYKPGRQRPRGSFLDTSLTLETQILPSNVFNQDTLTLDKEGLLGVLHGWHSTLLAQETISSNLGKPSLCWAMQLSC